MMKMRQQPDSTYINKINKQKALFIHNLNSKSSGCSINKHEAPAGFMNMNLGGNYGVDYERDESPVSVISHSASVISQPSSACTSMEHHLMLNPNLISPKPAPNHSFATSPYAYKQEQFSVGTSAASTSEDDSSAYNLPTLFFEVAPVQDEISKAQPQVFARKDNSRSSSGEEELGTQQIPTKQNKRKSFINSGTASVGDSLKSDDDEHMISINLQEWQENSQNSPLHRERYIKGSENKLSKQEEKQAVDESFAALGEHDEWKRDQRLERSTSNGQAALEEPASKTTKFHHMGDRPATHEGMYVAETSRGPQPAQRNANLFIQKAPPSLASRQKSINSTKSSKWDDAEKWLCYDNHVSRYHTVENPSYSVQKRHVNNASLDRGVLSASKASNECKDTHASPNRGNFGVSNVYEFKDHHGLKDDAACVSGANHVMMQNSHITPSRGSLSIDVMPRSKHACASQSSNSNGNLVDKMLEDDYLRMKWFGANAGTCRKGDFDSMSCSEIANPHVLSNKLAAICVSDGEIHAKNASNYQLHHATQMSISSGSVSGEDSKKKDYNFRTTIARWKKDNSDESMAPHQVRECDYLSSGELLSQANNYRNLTTISASDGEVCANYASSQQHKNNPSYTQRFRQHQLLQKLRRKYSPSNGGHKEAVQHVREDDAQNSVGKNAYGRAASLHAASRLSISTQASPQFCSQGKYARTLSVGKLENELARDESVCINAGFQREFVVQTPTHGRSASMKDACTEVSPTISRRDMGTQMTPSESSPITSKCTSPMQNTSPARHNTPARTSPPLNSQVKTDIGNDGIDIAKDDEPGTNSSAQKETHGNALELESCHWTKLELRDLQTSCQKNDDLGSVYDEWSSGVCGEGEIVADGGDHESDAVEEMHSGGIIKRLSVLDARAAAWEGAERAKFFAKYKREEARINAWETLQKAKAEAELKKLEVKLEKLRSKATEKVLSKVAAAERRAEEMRAAAEAQQAEQMRKVRERACNLRKSALFPGSFAVCFARNYMP